MKACSCIAKAEEIRYKTAWPAFYSVAKNFTILRKVCGCGNVGSIFERSEYGETCQAIGMPVPWGVLRGYGDRRDEASFASEAVDHTKKLTKNTENG